MHGVVAGKQGCTASWRNSNKNHSVALLFQSFSYLARNVGIHGVTTSVSVEWKPVRLEFDCKEYILVRSL